MGIKTYTWIFYFYSVKIKEHYILDIENRELLNKPNHCRSGNRRTGGFLMKVYDFTVKDDNGSEVSLSEYEGKVLMIVNTATKCGLTPQYKALEALYEKYHEQGFEILDFPCNQFMNQAPGTDEEIHSFCTLNYGTTFPRFSKIDVNGDKADPLYVWLKEQAPEDDKKAAFDTLTKLMSRKSRPGDIKWNFGKFLIDRSGNVAGRYSPGCTPEKLEQEIEALLNR